MHGRHPRACLDRSGHDVVAGYLDGVYMTKRIYFDGSYSETTKDMHGAIVCDGDENWSPMGLKGSSSTESEWLAALDALDYAVTQGFRDVVMIGDSLNVVDAMRGKIGTGTDLARYRRHAEKTVEEVGSVRWEWIASKKNPAGELLRRLAAKGMLRPKGLLG